MRNEGGPLLGGEEGVGYRVGMLKSRIAVDAHDDEARRELVAIYRELRHPDQAGRYAIAIEELATRDELRAYGAMLRGIQADDVRLRTLSRLPQDADLPADTRDALEDKVGPDSGGILGAILPTLWAAAVASVLVAPLFTFVSALLGLPEVRAVAVIFSLVALGATFLASTFTALWYVAGRSCKVALAWFLVSSGLAAAALLLPR